MPFFGVPIRNGLPIGLGSVAGFGVQQFDPSQLFAGGTVAGAWYDPSDLSTMFTTSAGTTQCAMPGQGSAVSVGLMLDKSQGLVLGSELVDTANTAAAWTPYGSNTVTNDDGAVKITFVGGTDSSFGAFSNLNAAGCLSQNLTAGKYYEISFSARVNSGNSVEFGIRNGSTTPFVAVATITNTGYTAYKIRFATNASYISVPNFTLNGSFGAGEVIWVKDISVRELPGNHAIAFNDTTARPELRARVNLLTFSEQFGNAAWTKSDGAVVTNNAAIAPDGTLTADQLDFGSLSTSRIQQVVSGPSESKVYSIWAKVASGTENIRFGEATLESQFTLTTTWQRLPYTLTQTGANFTVVNSAAGGAKTIYIWGADLRPANIGANVPAYQRIADANTYDTSGFPLYLRFDGIDDSMYTPANLNLSGTDKVAVFAGVRKQAAGLGFVAELSSNTSANNGSFYVVADNGTNDYGMSARGTSQGAYQPQTYTAPISNVLTASYDIAGATLATEIVPRVNGAVVQTVPSGSCGTGNFGTYPLYIGARNNASGWLNGHLHSLIIAGSAVSAGNISATEQWVAQKTGLALP